MKRKTAKQLEELAEKSSQALAFLVGEGYSEQVDVIRNFIQAEGENHRAMTKIQRDVANDLSKQLERAGIKPGAAA